MKIYSFIAFFTMAYFLQIDVTALNITSKIPEQLHSLAYLDNYKGFTHKFIDLDR